MTATAVDTRARDSRMYDVFLSYNGPDEVAVAVVAAALRDRGFEVWFAPWCIAGGDHLIDALEDGLERSAACIFFVGRSGLERWVVPEYRIACRRAVERGMRMIPVVLPDAGHGTDVTARLPGYLATQVWVDLRGGVERRDLVDGLAAAVTGTPTAPGARAPTRCPYVGLDSFGPDDAPYFVGRQADVQRVVECVDANVVAAVTAPMGAGKSSLVRAGVVPALATRAAERGRRVDVVGVRPGRRPWLGIAAALRRVPVAGAQPTRDATAGRSGGRGAAAIAARLEHDPRWLGSLLTERRQAAPDDAILLVVDQFEEIFTADDGSDPRAVLEALGIALEQTGSFVTLLVTMRIDFLDRIAVHAGMAHRLAAGQYILPELDGPALREVVEEPARRAGLVVAPGLAELMVTDLDGASAPLPMLQQALVETWRNREGNVLTLQAYRRAGSAAGAIATRAEREWSALDTDARRTARFALRQLVAVDTERIVGRRRQLAELRPAGVTPVALTTALARFADARLVTITSDESGGKQAELTHEAIVEAWDRFVDWVRADEDWARLHDRLAQRAAVWDSPAGGRSEDYVYRGRELAEVQEAMRDHDRLVSDPVQRFLDASVEAAVAREADRTRRIEESARADERARQQRRRVRLMAVSSVVTATLAVLTLVFFLDARQQRTVARALQMAAVARDVGADRPGTAALVATGAVELADTAETRGALADVLSRPWTPHTVLGHTGSSVRSVATTQDGTHVLVGDVTGQLHVHDLVDLRHDTAPVRGAGAFTAVVVENADSVLVGDEGGDVLRLGWPELSVTTRIARVDGAVRAIEVVSPGLLTLLTDDGSVLVWDEAAKEAIARFGTGITAMTSGPDEGRLVVGDDVGGLTEWDVRLGVPIWETPAVHLGAVRSISITADGSVLSGGDDTIVRRTEPGRPAGSTALRGHDRPVVLVEQLPTSADVVLSIGDDGSVLVHDDGSLVGRQPIGPPAIDASPTLGTFVTAATMRGRQLVLGMADGRRAVVDALGRPPLATADRAYADDVRRVHLGASGELLAWLDDGRLVDPAGGARRLRADHVVALRDGGLVLARDEHVEVLTRASSAPRPLGAAAATVSALAPVGPDSVGVGRDDGSVTIVDTATGEVGAASRPADESAGVLAGGADFVVSGHDDGTVAVTTVDGAARVLGAHDLPVTAVDATDRWVVSGSDDNRILRWELASDGGEQPTVVGRFSDMVTGLSIVEDDRVLAGSQDGELALFDLATGTRLATLPTPVAGRVQDVRVLAEGVAVAVGDRVRVWNLDEGSWAAAACRAAGRPLRQFEVDALIGGVSPPGDTCPTS